MEQCLKISLPLQNIVQLGVKKARSANITKQKTFTLKSVPAKTVVLLHIENHHNSTGTHKTT